jgi:hypothetical protein
MEDGVTGEGTAALLVEQGTIISKSSSHRKSKEDGDGSVACKRKGKLIKRNMTRYNNVAGGDVKTKISFVCQRIAQEHTCSRPRGKLMRGGRLEIGVAEAPKNSQVIIGGGFSKEVCIRDVTRNGG